MAEDQERFAALREGERRDFSYNQKPKCPHCGIDFDIERNEAWFIYDENETHDVDCGDCGEAFKIESNASWTFSTDEQEEFQ